MTLPTLLTARWLVGMSAADIARSRVAAGIQQPLPNHHDPWRCSIRGERAVAAENTSGFAWSVAPDANVDFFGEVDRAPLAIARLIRDTDFRPAYDMDRAVADYLEAEPVFA